ncbi:MAG: hypothetical protein OK457_10565 [Thaumarchaeota archaeon]|nr:hypothetical protein [Nitrososphaerota archaeon]
MSTRSPVRGIFAFFRSRPILLLLMLTPGIPEYLSGSSAVNALFFNPFMFVFQILANLGLYGPGVLLIREAKIRWDKGWATVLLLGAAYGILEEGIALSTLFNPTAGPVGQFGFFGHWLGVNWVWTAGIVPVHMIFSISLPILLLGLAAPETQGKSLLKSRKSIVTTFGILFLDASMLFFFVLLGEHFWMGWPVFGASLVSIGALVYSARKVPSNALNPKTETPVKRPRVTGVLGAIFYPSVLFVEFLGMGAKLPAFVVTLLVVLIQLLFLGYILRIVGRSGNERNLIALATGLVLPLAAFGIISQISLPLVLIVDVALFAFFRRLWKTYGSPVPIRPSEQTVVSPN